MPEMVCEGDLTMGVGCAKIGLSRSEVHLEPHNDKAYNSHPTARAVRVPT